MNPPIEKVASLLPLLEARGPVYLFAFAERDDISRWDVILSAAWSNEDRGAARRVIGAALRARLKPEEMRMLGMISIVPADTPGVQQMPDDYDGVTPKDKKVVLFTFLGSGVRQAYLFRAQRPPAAAPVEAMAGVAH